MTGKRAERLQIMLTQKEVRAVDEWRFANKMPSRSAAARALMNLGLSAVEGTIDADALLEAGVASGDIGIVDVDPTVEAALDQDTRPRILVANSDFLAARGIMSVVSEIGLNAIGPALECEEAISIANELEPIAAVLDVRLGGRSVEKLVDTLSQSGVSYLFCSSEDPKDFLPERLWSTPLVSKASVRTALQEAVSALLKQEA